MVQLQNPMCCDILENLLSLKMHFVKSLIKFSSSLSFLIINHKAELYEFIVL